MRRYETVGMVQNEIQRTWNFDFGSVMSDSRLFNVTLYADVAGTWRRFIVGPLDVRLAKQLLMLDGDNWAVEEVRRVIIGSTFADLPDELFPEIHVW